MYELLGKIGPRGFYLEKAGRQIFVTKHKFGFTQNSSVMIGGDHIAVKAHNLMGLKFSILKNGFEIGSLDLTSYLHSKIYLTRKDGSVDVFKLEEQGFSQIYALSHLGVDVLKFTVSLNPLRMIDIFRVDVLSDKFPSEAVEELMFYAGEILFRQVGSNVGAGL